jgi:hypothetical protein
MSRWSIIWRRTARVALGLLLVVALLGRSVLEPGDRVERVRAYTRSIEFDFVAWTWDALELKLRQLGLGAGDYLFDERSNLVVLDYLDLVRRIQMLENQLNQIFADPSVRDPQSASQELRAELKRLYHQRQNIAPLAESIMQNQVSVIAAELGLTLGGQPIPPVMYHVTPLPVALIVSPRDVIEQIANISLLPDLTVDQRVSLEEQVDRNLNLSSLVVNIGGVGLYPTMVMQTSSLNWLAEVVSHEWTHNFLSLRPLGVNYYGSPELRTMNETTASIAGVEIGRAVIARFYPELLPPPPEPPPEEPDQPALIQEPPAFDFRAEMRETRITVDALLAEGEIEQAEAYMEARRLVFWENGYLIRKLNQAYFAFYGAYADQPGGAAGEDPVGAAVRALRAQSPSLAAFLNQISWIWSFEQLKDAVNQGP